MAKNPKNPTDPMRLKASRYPEVDEGTSCTQSSFKTGGKAFFFIGEQGGRYKAMFKLDASKPQAIKLASAHPGDYQAGACAWVTARFSADAPMPATLWKAWLDESYALSRKPAAKKKTGAKKKKAKAKSA